MIVKSYVRAQSVDEAYQLLSENRNNRILGGMLWLKMQDLSINTAIDLCDCNLDNIEENEEEICLGAMVTLHQLETYEPLKKIYSGMIAESVKDIVGVQFKNLATLGGSIFSRFGFSDLLTSLLALPVDVETYKRGRISLSEFIALPYEVDILTHIYIKKKKGIGCYLSERRSATDFPVLAVAIAYIDDKFYISIGARPKKAQLLVVDETVIPTEVVAQVKKEMAFHSNMRASKEYREHLMNVLIQRGMKILKEEKSC